jgi:hypothetical protein
MVNLPNPLCSSDTQLEPLSIYCIALSLIQHSVLLRYVGSLTGKWQITLSGNWRLLIVMLPD